MRILYLPKWYPRCDSPVSGIFVKEFAKVAAKYHEVAVIHAYPDPSMAGLFSICDSVEENIRVIRVAHKQMPGSYLLFLVSTFIAFRRLREDFLPDLVHVHVYSASFLAYVLKKLLKIPYVVTEHYAVLEEDFGVANPGERRLGIKVRILLEKLAFSNAAMLVNVSRFMDGQIRKLGVRTRSRIIPNIADTTVFFTDGNRKAFNRDKKDILFVGLPSHRKGLDSLLSATSRLHERRDDFIVHIIGDSESRIGYENLSRSSGISESVLFHGSLSKSEISEFMRKASFLVLPSIWENLPCAIIEAMACGLPVVATDVGGVRELVNRDTGILVSPDDIDMLTESMEYMLDNYLEFDSRLISEYAMSRFGCDVVGEQLREIYNVLTC